MRYVTSIERLAKEEGLEQGMQHGMQQGKSSALLRQLKMRFGDLPVWVPDKLAQAREDELDCWIDTVLTASTIDRVFAPDGRL
ncbi:MAG: hypothetical protein RL404_2750 [Pseudomonadota bacterium]|jgi:hypothetical protein